VRGQDLDLRPSFFRLKSAVLPTGISSKSQPTSSTNAPLLPSLQDVVRSYDVDGELLVLVSRAFVRPLVARAFSPPSWRPIPS
jgi:hypothetical protein